MGFFRADMCSGENCYTEIHFKDPYRLFEIQTCITCLASKLSERLSQVVRVIEEINFLWLRNKILNKSFTIYTRNQPLTVIIPGSL
jgi:hypothetical protein